MNNGDNMKCRRENCNFVPNKMSTKNSINNPFYLIENL